MSPRCGGLLFFAITTLGTAFCLFSFAVLLLILYFVLALCAALATLTVFLTVMLTAVCIFILLAAIGMYLLGALLFAFGLVALVEWVYSCLLGLPGSPLASWDPTRVE